MAFALIYIWNGKDFFRKKEWFVFFIKIASVLIFSFILVFILVGISKYLHLISREAARELVVVIPVSFITILFAKFFVVMLNAIFSIVMLFHKRFNTTENYLRLSVLFNNYGPGLRFFTKCLASFGAAFILYVTWLGNTLLVN